METLSNKVVETLRRFQEADRRLASSARPGVHREDLVRDYIKARREHQQAIEAVEAEMNEQGDAG